jgi:hypothetical protein
MSMVKKTLPLNLSKIFPKFLCIKVDENGC